MTDELQKFLYKDNTYLPLREIHRKEPELTINQLRYRYKRYGDDLEKIFGIKSIKRKRYQERGDLDSIPSPTEYEKKYC